MTYRRLCSGLSVQGPGRRDRDRDPPTPLGHHIQEIMRRAAECASILRTAGGLFVFTRRFRRGSRRRFEEEGARSGPFQGTGHRLGDEETPSAAVPDPTAPAEREMETAVRVITFWRNGFTIEDGPLLAYDNPQNTELLELINSGCVPVESMHSILSLTNLDPDMPHHSS